VGFVENENHLVAAIGMKPLPRLAEYLPLNGAHQHVFEHGIVGDEQVRAPQLRLVPGHHFTVARLRDEPPVPMPIRARTPARRPDFLFVLGVEGP
jgi:hypothetical protein